MKTLERRTSPRTGDAIWMKFECGAGSRWTSTTEDSSGDVCNFSGCNCGTKVRKVGETDDRYENWFGLHAANAVKVCVSFVPLVNEGGNYRGTYCCTCGEKEESHKLKLAANTVNA